MTTSTLFGGMERLNKASLGLFAAGKLAGMVGVALGFAGEGYHRSGGYLLCGAFVMIFSAVVCSLVQLRRDRRRFDIEDTTTAELRRLALRRVELEENIRELESRRTDLQNFIATRG